MKERPIIFTAENVRLILAGEKTQTRRILKPQPECTGGSNLDRIEYAESLGWVPTSPSGKVGIFSPFSYRCPYGIVGDRLWVRETWGLHCMAREYTPESRVYYRADPDINPSHHSWRSPIFMPRSASRITLEIERILVMRLHDIHDHDAIAEGVTVPLPVNSYREMWDGINGKRRPWDSNPWVWALTFKVVGATR